MSSIWTPNGEHEIKRPQRHTSVNAQTSEEAGEQDASQTLSDLEKQIRSTPVQDIIANHCYGLFQLAAIHLSSVPPNMKDASLAIDAMTAVIQKANKSHLLEKKSSVRTRRLSGTTEVAKGDKKQVRRLLGI